MRILVLLVVLSLAAPALAQSPAPPDKVRAALAKALELARAGKDADAVQLLDRIVRAAPRLTSARLLRAKVLYRLKRFEDAEVDAVSVLKEAPATAGINELLARIRENIKPVTVTLVGGAATYSEWQWSWTLDGAKPFKLADYKGGEGFTLFYWPSRPGVKSDWEKLEEDASSSRLYFLRVISCKAASGEVADLTMPGFTDHGVGGAPYMMWMDGSGTVVAKGSPAEVVPKIEAFKKEKKDAATPTDPVSKVDVSASTPAFDTFARSGWTTIVMAMSPACHACDSAKPKIEAIPQNHSKVRVVMADIGVTPTGGINWNSPWRLANKIPKLPYFYVVDPSGAVSGSGDTSSGVLKAWLGE